MGDDNSIVKEERLRKLWSQAKLSQEAGVAIRTIARVENGINCSELTKRRIAQALGKEVEYLFPL